MRVSATIIGQVAVVAMAGVAGAGWGSYHRQPLVPVPVSSSAPASAQVFFSPQEDLEKVWVQHIDGATRTIHLACFGISNARIAGALKKARDRGVEVILIEDNRQSSLAGDQYDRLSNAGCKVVIKRSKTLLHDKMGVFDGRSALIGSYNLSETAQDQDNSLVMIENIPAQVERCEAAWNQMFRREVGRAYQPGMDLPPVTPKGW